MPKTIIDPENLTPEVEEKVKQAILQYDRRKGACSPGRNHWKKAIDSKWNLRQTYDTYPFPVHYVWTNCKVAPEETFDIICKVIENKIPITGAPDELMKAKDVLLDKNTSEKESRDASVTIEHLSGQWREYSRVIFYMLLWKGKLKESTIAIPVVEKMSKYLRNIGITNHNKILGAWIREYIPYEDWIKGVVKRGIVQLIIEESERE